MLYCRLVIFYCLFITGRTFPVEQIFLEEIMDITNYVLEENGPFARKIKKGSFIILFSKVFDVLYLEGLCQMVNLGMLNVDADSGTGENIFLSQ